ncbi:MAG: endo-1,4-beta-xylanase [Planctomycetaceae bacterium]|nr:endo-1,4-beta-xylanase [Planctomycetaceae bacterium]
MFGIKQFTMLKKYSYNLFIVFSLFVSTPAFAQFGNNWRSEAEARIEKYRKEDITVKVVQNGQPVKNAQVKIHMQESEFLFGCNIFGWEGNDTKGRDWEYRRLFDTLFNFATVPFYWGGYEPEKGKPDYAKSERIAAWCAENGIRTKGHPLVYSSLGSNPAWIKNMSDEELLQAVTERVTACVEHFRGKIDTWDVINEIVYWPVSFPDTRLTQLGVKTGTVELAKVCLTAARKANPDATLIVNDNNWGDKFADVLSQLVDADGKPLYDVIGIQSHFHMASGRWDNQRLWEVCERFAQFGKPLHFTELTILSTKENCKSCNNVPTSKEGEQWQKEEVLRVYTMLFSHPAVEAITWWDFSDQKAWLGAPSGLIHKDMKPKPAYWSLHNLIGNVWKSRLTVETDEKGEIRTRVFRGQYRFVVTMPDGKTVKSFLGTVKKGKNEFELDCSFFM